MADDVSARDLQGRESQWTRAKGFDTSCPFGPWVTTADEVPDPEDLALRTWVNGELRQDARTSDLVFGIAELVAFLAETITLAARRPDPDRDAERRRHGARPAAVPEPRATSCASRSRAWGASSMPSPEVPDAPPEVQARWAALLARVAELDDLQRRRPPPGLGPADDDAARRRRSRAARSWRRSRAWRTSGRPTTGCSSSSTSSTRGPSASCPRTTSAPTSCASCATTSSAPGACPSDLTTAISLAGSEALPVWQRARAESDWAAFAPYLERHVALRRQLAACHPAEHPYDALLETYEPGMTDRGAARPLRAPASPGSARCATPPPRSPRPSSRGPSPCASSASWRWRWPRAMGFDEAHWRLDDAVHPFAQSVAPTDIRVTSRFAQDDLNGLFAVLHEVGHGLYERRVGPGARPHGARHGGLARDPRVPEPAVGELRRAQPPVLGALAAARRRTCSPRCATTGSTGSCARSTRCARRSSASRPTRRPTRCTSSCASSSRWRSSRATSRWPTSRRRGTRGCAACSASPCRTTAAARCRTSTGRSGSSATSRPTRSARSRPRSCGGPRAPTCPTSTASLEAGDDGAAARLAGRARPPPRPPAGARRAAAARHRLELRPRPPAGPPAGEARRAVRAAPLAPGRRPVAHATAAVWLAAHPCPFAPRTSRGPSAPRWRSSCSWPPRSPARRAPAAATAPGTA